MWENTVNANEVFSNSKRRSTIPSNYVLEVWGTVVIWYVRVVDAPFWYLHSLNKLKSTVPPCLTCVSVRGYSHVRHTYALEKKSIGRESINDNWILYCPYFMSQTSKLFFELKNDELQAYATHLSLKLAFFAHYYLKFGTKKSQKYGDQKISIFLLLL